MNAQPASKTFTSRLVVILAGLFAATLLVVWVNKSKSPPISAAVDTSSAGPAAVTEPAPAEPAALAAPAEPPPSGPLETRWGIHVTSVALLRAGTALNVSYKVVTPEKAVSLTKDEIAAYLIDQASGTKILMNSPQQSTENMPPHSRARSAAMMARLPGSFPPKLNQLVAGRTNIILFPNTGGIVKSGSKVTVMVGDAQADNIMVE